LDDYFYSEWFHAENGDFNGKRKIRHEQDWRHGIKERRMFQLWAAERKVQLQVRQPFYFLFIRTKHTKCTVSLQRIGGSGFS